MKGKRMAFVGDSLSRNQWESMLCLLSETLPNKSRVFEIHGEKIGKHKGSYIFKFQVSFLMLSISGLYYFYALKFIMLSVPRNGFFNWLMLKTIFFVAMKSSNKVNMIFSSTMYKYIYELPIGNV